MAQNTYPYCRLTGNRIIDLFPPRCPLAQARCLASLTTMQDGAWRILGLPTGDQAWATAELRRVSVCLGCITELLGDPWIRRLHERRHTTDVALPQQRMLEGQLAGQPG